jgi:tRNA-Thr(GGU) m(6)t(6)A37 methyltransferase TsaA
MRLSRIGTVRNRIKTRHEVGQVGAASTVELAARYARAAEGLMPGCHVWVLCWLHKAERKTLKVVPRKISSALAERGVFATRSPDRPNPVSLSCAKLLSRRGRRLRLDLLDVLDGTPVVDIKMYSPGIDCVPNAFRPDYARKYSLMPDASLKIMLNTVARRRSGGLSRGARLAAGLAFRWIRASGLAPDSGLACISTNLPADGVEALHGLFNIPASSRNIRVVRGKRNPWLKVRLSGRTWLVQGR